MVIVTIQHTSHNIKSFFLLDFIEQLKKVHRGRRLDDKKIQAIADELGVRIETDEFMNRQRSFDRVLELYDKGIKS